MGNTNHKSPSSSTADERDDENKNKHQQGKTNHTSSGIGGEGWEPIDYTIRAPYDPKDKRYIQSFQLTSSLIHYIANHANNNDNRESDTSKPCSILSPEDILLAQDILHFYETYGFVVFDNILNDEEIEFSINDLWKALSLQTSTSSSKRDDPTTWYRINHPFSFIGNEPFLDASLLQLWLNRQHSNVYAAFKLLYAMTTTGECSNPYNDHTTASYDPLIACFDRGSIMPPTRGPYGKPEWQTCRVPHFDMNPFIWTNTVDLSEKDQETQQYLVYEDYRLLLAEGNNTHPVPCPTSSSRNGATGSSKCYPKLRAVLQFSDSTAEKGGFECLVGFHRYIKTWCQENRHLCFPQGSKDSKMTASMSAHGWGVETNSPLDLNMQRITIRAGSMIIFSAELPHTMFPNDSDSFRYAQYLRMTPLSTLALHENEEMLPRRKLMIQPLIPVDLEKTNISREVFML